MFYSQILIALFIDFNLGWANAIRIVMLPNVSHNHFIFDHLFNCLDLNSAKRTKQLVVIPILKNNVKPNQMQEPVWNGHKLPRCAFVLRINKHTKSLYDYLTQQNVPFANRNPCFFLIFFNAYLLFHEEAWFQKKNEHAKVWLCVIQLLLLTF